MKIKLVNVISIVFILSIVVAARGQAQVEHSSANTIEAKSMQLGAWRSSQLVGINVITEDGERVGTISDMVGDVKGKVLYLVLSHGGILGVGDKLIPIPWDSIKPTEQGRSLTVKLSKQSLEKAPNFDSKKWPDFNQAEWNDKMKKYYASYEGKEGDR